MKRIVLMALLIFSSISEAGFYRANDEGPPSGCAEGTVICISGGSYTDSALDITYTYWDVYSLADDPCTNGQSYNQSTYSCDDPDPCEDAPNPAQCSCDGEGRFWNSFNANCEDIQQCDSSAGDTYDPETNMCFDNNDCQQGYSVNAQGQCVADPTPDPEPDPDPDPTPEPQPDPEPNNEPDPDPNQDTDGDSQPDATDPDDDNDGTNDASDDDIDGDGVQNINDADYTMNVDVSGVEERLNTTNEKLSTIDQRLDTTNQHLNQMEHQSKQQTDKLEEIASGLGSANVKLTGIDDNVAELNDFVTEENPDTTTDTNSTPTIAETNARISQAITTHPFIADVFNVPTIGTGSSCPTYTFELGTFGSHTMDIHCTVLESERSTLSALFIGIWTLLAAIIFLRA